MTETEEVTWGLPSRSHCGREMDYSGRQKLELKLSGLGASRSKWGSIRIMLDDGWGKTAQGTRRVKFTYGEWMHTWTRPVLLWGRASTNRDSRDDHSITNQHTQSTQQTPARINQHRAPTLSDVQTHVLAASALLFKYSPTSLHLTAIFLLMWSKTTKRIVPRKAVITVTKPFTENQSVVPDGGAFVHSALWTGADHSCVYILVIHPLCTCFFSRMTVLNLSPLAILNPIFAEFLRCFNLLLFIIPCNLLCPLTCYSIQYVDTHLFPLEICCSFYFFAPAVPSRCSESSR